LFLTHTAPRPPPPPPLPDTPLSRPPDSPASFVAQAGTLGSYGNFAIDSAGAWTYTASSPHNEFVAGTTYTDSFDVVSADGTHTSEPNSILLNTSHSPLSSDVRNLTE